MITSIGHKIVVMSDLHLGMTDCKPKKILSFLENIQTDILVLNGDIIDFDAMKRGAKWKKKHTSVLMKLLEMSKTIRIIYIRGNHDDDIREMFNMPISNIEFMDEYIYSYDHYEDGIFMGEKRMLIFHGDKVDVMSSWKFLTYLGSIGYDMFLRLNTWYNKIREFFGLPYYSISKVVKEGFKEAVVFINNFETEACNYAKNKGCQSVMCGHIHIPSIKKIDDIYYYNSGDWVENFTAIGMTEENIWTILK